MTIQALYSAASGMSAMESKLDVISNNLANMETTGFKKDRLNFEDVFYRHEKMPGTQDAAGNYTPVGIQIGLGTRVQSTQTDFDQGSLATTGNQLDVAIEGDGFFVVQNTDGSLSYTRAGNFSLNANGQIVLGSASIGRLLEPSVSIPTDATEISISSDGTVFVLQPNNTQLQQVGNIQLAAFINPQGLLKVGENLYNETDASGPPTVVGTPGQDGLGTLQQNTLEMSNVEPVNEMIDLITTQRAFELNSQAVKTGDAIMETITNLKRY